jgi:hypothetical protein
VTRFLLASILGSALLLSACGSSRKAPRGEDSGTVRRDGGGVIMFMDSGTPPPRDSGTPGIDTGTPPPRDSGTPPRDSGGMVTPGDGTIGSSCTGPADCTEGTSPMCVMNFMGFIAFPGGYCTSGCTGPGTCPAGAECIDIMGTMFCGATCTTAADCRSAEGYTCGMPPIGGDGMTMYCLPPGL